MACGRRCAAYPKYVGSGLVSYITSIAVRLCQCGSLPVILIRPDVSISRTSNQRTANTAIGRGGDCAPNPGRSPAGANGIESNATSSMSGSTIEDVNNCQ